jgi:hypothetical protein
VTDAVKEELQQQSDAVYEMLTNSEREAVDYYTLLGSKAINSSLRDERYDSDKIRGYAESIDSAMGKFELKRDIIAYRGDEARWYDDWEVNDVKPLKAFTSASVSETVAREKFADEAENRGERPIFIEIYIPKGTRGIYIGSNTAYRHNQDEFLLGCGLNYRVTEKKGNILKLEAIHE